MNEITPPTKPSATLINLGLIGAAGVALRLLLSQTLRQQTSNPRSPLVWAFALGALLAAIALLRVFLRVWRCREDVALDLTVALAFIFLFKLGKYRPEISSWELPLALFALTPAALLISALIRKIRGADELERQILLESLAISFVVALAAAVAYAFLEGLGLPRPPSILWATLLVVSWSIVLGIRSARFGNAPVETSD